LGTPPKRATPKFGGLVIAVAAVAEKAKQQHDERKDRDQNHEQPGGVGKVVNRTTDWCKQARTPGLARKNRLWTAGLVPDFFERLTQFRVVSTPGTKGDRVSS
jgi:hypothetical protein